MSTDINKFNLIVEKKKQLDIKKAELQNASPENVEEQLGTEVSAVRKILEVKKEESIDIIKDLSDEEVLSRMEAEKEPSLLDKIKQNLLTENAAKSDRQMTPTNISLNENNTQDTRTISAGTTYNITLTNPKDSSTTTYTLTTDKTDPQDIQIVMDVNSNRLVVKGNNLKIETSVNNGTNSVMLMGYNGTIQVGKDTQKKYSAAANIMYESDKSGSAISR